MKTPAVSALAVWIIGFAGAAQAEATRPGVSGVVAGTGYYQRAKVCIDANGNGRCDAGETFTVTDTRGHFVLKGRGAVVAQIGTAATLLDAKTHEISAVTRALVLRAPANAATVVSPISTELMSLMDKNGGDFVVASRELATRVGVDTHQLLEDALQETDAGVKASLLSEDSGLLDRIAYAVAEAGTRGDRLKSLDNRLNLDRVTNVVVIYAENRSFDNLYGSYPGANGLTSTAAKAIKQLDRDGVTVLKVLPPAWGGMTAPGQTPVVTQAQTTNVWPNAPFQIDAPGDRFGYGLVSHDEVTRDLYHRFFENAMQINGGKNNMFAAWGDSGGLVMGHFDGSKTQVWKLAKRYTLADNFFQGAYGGSFLNHQYLICACAPTVSPAFVAHSKPSINVLAGTLEGVPQLAANAAQPASALDGAPNLKTGNIAPLDYFGVGDGYRAVNTMQPAYQPSGNKPADHNGNDVLYADPAVATTLEPQTQTNIGDLLSAKGLSWAWFSDGWASATANPYPYNADTASFGSSTTIYNANASGTADAAHLDFQAHHQPFNYFARFDPVAHAAERAAHLKDRSDLLVQARAGTLPAVSFYKPIGNRNQHPGYTNVSNADSEIAGIIGVLEQSPQWPHLLIVVTYDEFGGQFDHVAPPRGDLLGPGTRIPALIISAYAKKGRVDHTPYDTGSILRFIIHRFSLPVLNGVQVRDQAVQSSTGKPLGDLTNALDFTQASF